MRTLKELIETIENNWATTEAPCWDVCSIIKCEETEDLLCDLKRAHARENYEQLLNRLDGQRAMYFMIWAMSRMVAIKMKSPAEYESMTVADLVREYDSWRTYEKEINKKVGS